MGCTDEWSGFAVFLANMIEKYASELDLDDLPELDAAEDDNSAIETDKRE